MGFKSPLGWDTFLHLGHFSDSEDSDFLLTGLAFSAGPQQDSVQGKEKFCTYICIYMWLDIGKLTKMSRLAYSILLAQLIDTLICTLPVHCCINRLSWLICLSRAYCRPCEVTTEPMGVLDGRYGSDIHPCVSETCLRPSRLVWTYDWHFLDL